MKKIILSLVMMLALASTASAQDTLYLRGTLFNNYLYDGDFLPFTYYVGFPPSYLGGCGYLEGGSIEHAKKFVIEDSLTIYGIAAGLRVSWGIYDQSVIYDTSYTYSYEYLRLYKPRPEDPDNPLECIGQLKVHMGTTPISYYATYDISSQFANNHVIPMYERYFSSPITVAGEFYAGITQYISIPPVAGYEYYCPPIGVCQLADTSGRYVEEFKVLLRYPTGNIWVGGSLNELYTCYFPILTPPNGEYEWTDTTYLGSDTTMMGDTLIVRDTIIYAYDTIITYDTLLAIDDHSLQDRLVGVMPNPATETAKVVSSFGVTMVEAFNMAGEKVHTLRLPDTPLTATLDVRRWPSGTYLLRIHTPQGTAVKKLVVN